MSLIKRTGFGQVEPNHLSAQRTSQIYAQLPANKDLAILENGQFVKYDYANKEVNLTGKGEFMLVLNEVKLYDENRESYKDFAMISKNYLGGEMVPRLFKTNVGDIYTTNCVGGANTSRDAEYAGIELVAGDLLKVDAATGYLVKETAELADSTETMLWEVVKVYNMADLQPAVKIMRVK